MAQLPPSGTATVTPTLDLPRATIPRLPSPRRSGSARPAIPSFTCPPLSPASRDPHARLAARYDTAIPLAAPVGLGSTGNPVFNVPASMLGILALSLRN